MQNKKTAVVTGATLGIGKEVARGLVNLGMKVVLVGRDEVKARRVVDELKAEKPDAEVLYRVADLSRPGQVSALAASLSTELSSLEVLVNNAGGYFAEREITPDGFEKTFALNHLGYFVLTQGLLPLLKKSAPARIVNLSSAAHWGSEVDVTDLQFEKRPWRAGWPAYGASKLANILFTLELSKRLVNTQVTVNAVHPGFVASGFGHNNEGFLSGFLKASQKIFARNSVKGAETAIYLASSEKVEGVSGKYFVDLKARTPSKAARDETLARELWEATERALAAVSLQSAA